MELSFYYWGVVTQWQRKILCCRWGLLVFTQPRNCPSISKNADVEITLIDRHSYFTYMTELHEVATERVEPEHINDLQRLLRRKTFVSWPIPWRASTKAQTATIEHGSYQYDQLLISLGGESNDFGIPGVKEHGFELWSFEQAMACVLTYLQLFGGGGGDPAKQSHVDLYSLWFWFYWFWTDWWINRISWCFARDNKLDPSEITLQLSKQRRLLLTCSTGRKPVRPLSTWKTWCQNHDELHDYRSHEDHVNKRQGSNSNLHVNLDSRYH